MRPPLKVLEMAELEYLIPLNYKTSGLNFGVTGIFNI